MIDSFGLKDRRINKLNYVSIFILIYLSSSFYGLSIKGSINLSLLLATSIITFIINSKKKGINLKALFLVLFIIISTILTMLINSESPYQYLIFWTSLLSAYLVYIFIDIYDFITIFTRVMYFICIFSLLTFAILLVVPSAISFLPVVTNSAGLTVHNLFFSVVHDSSYFNANYGLFWEPGAYQTFINLALFFQIFILNDLSIKKILVYLITLFTTFSTTGYLAAIILIVIFILTKQSDVKEILVKRKKVIQILVVILIVGVICFNFLPGNVKFKLFGKLEAIINPELVNTNSAYISTTSRIDAIKIPINNWLTSPFFGVGFSNLYNYTINDNTNFLTATPLNWFGLFGLFLGLILNLGIWKWSKIVNKGIFIQILIFLFLTFITLSEYYNMNAFLLILIIYGFTATPIKIRDLNTYQESRI